MLIPQFSIRWLLGATVACALLSWLVSFALTGAGWAALIAVTALAIAFILLLQAAAFGLVWQLGRLLPPSNEEFSRKEDRAPDPAIVQKPSNSPAP